MDILTKKEKWDALEDLYSCVTLDTISSAEFFKLLKELVEDDELPDIENITYD